MLGQLQRRGPAQPLRREQPRLAHGQPSCKRNACSRCPSGGDPRPAPWQPRAVTQSPDLLRRNPRLRQQPLASSRASQRASRRSVFALRRRPSRPRVCTGSASRMSKPCAESSRQTQRQPVVASIATAATRPRHSSAQRARLSRSAENRSSTTSPLSGSNTAAWKRAYGCRSPRTTSRTSSRRRGPIVLSAQDRAL